MPSPPIRRDLLPGLHLTFSEEDGSWIHFEGARYKGAFCLEAFADGDRVVGQAIREWCDTYRSTL